MVCHLVQGRQRLSERLVAARRDLSLSDPPDMEFGAGALQPMPVLNRDNSLQVFPIQSHWPNAFRFGCSGPTSRCLEVAAAYQLEGKSKRSGYTGSCREQLREHTAAGRRAAARCHRRCQLRRAAASVPPCSLLP